MKLIDKLAKVIQYGCELCYGTGTRKIYNIDGYILVPCFAMGCNALEVLAEYERYKSESQNRSK